MSALVCAAGDGQLAEVQRLLQEEQGIKIDGHAGDSLRTAIDAAIASGHAHVVQWLLEQGAYTDANQLSDAYKALAAERTNERESIVRMLYEWRRSATKSPSYGPLDDPQQLNHFVFMNDLSVVAMLIKSGADVNTVDRTTNLRPLLIAVQSNRQSMARILLEAGASVDQRASKHAADCDAEPTPLILGAASRAPSCVKLLLEHGASVHEVDAEGKTALARATEKGDIASMTLLLRAGSPVNTRTGTLLQKAGSPINTQAELGRTPLMTAARTLRSSDAVRMLLAHGAAVDLVDKDQWTALMHAAVFGNVESLASLLDAGSAINATSSGGETALSLLVSAAMYFPWSAELQAEERPKLRLLLERGAAVDQVNSDGWTALMLAAYDTRAQAADAVELLLQYGASLDIQTKTGDTALTFASDAKTISTLRAHSAPK